MRRLLPWLSLVVLAACSSSDDDDDAAPPETPPVVTTPPEAIAGTQAQFDAGADTGTVDGFFRFPYPSDLRLQNGVPDVRGWPNPAKLSLLEGLRTIAAERKGYPVLAAGYFRFDAPLAARADDQVMAADKASPVLLLDVDPSSPELGRLVPTVATVLPVDDYVPENLLAVAPRPGFILKPNRRYAFVVQRSLNDAAGSPLGAPKALEALKAGLTPEGARGAELAALYKPLWPALEKAGVDRAAVAAATVFTTGDVVNDLFQLSEQVRAQYKVQITDLHVDAVDGADHERFCEVRGKVTYPQFQRGTPPFNKDGTFDAVSGVPTKQRDEEAPITLTLPKGGAMPDQGYPLAMYFHGSGGLSTASVDRGTWRPTEDPTMCPPWPDTLQCPAKKDDPQSLLDEYDGKKGCNTAGQGPAYELAPHGIAMASSALPLNPERLACAEETAYLNFNNLAVFRDTFRQGVIEQRLFLDALSELTIDPAVVASCSGLSLPAGAAGYRFSIDRLVAMGQSMGGMYTNLVGAVEPRIQAVAPTGAGGFWSYFILKTQLISNIDKKVGLLLATKAKLSFLHPALQLLELAWEPAEPLAYMARLGHDPLPDHPARSIYEPAGQGDSYFPTEIYDAAVLAYGHRQAGEEVWPAMQSALSLDGREGLLPYPVASNNTSTSGKTYSAAIVQYTGDGLYDPHAIYTQRPEVKYQYACFFDSFLRTGTATIAAPQAPGSPCP